VSAEPTPPHRPATTPHASLYFPYRVHAPAPAAPVRDLPVAVVGAGPIGLVTALGLAQQGVRCTVLTAQLQVCEGSRAIVFTRRSMEILQQVGADAAVTAGGLPWRFGTSHYRGQPVFRLEAPHDEHDRFQPMINLQQQVLEQCLVAPGCFGHQMMQRLPHWLDTRRIQTRSHRLDALTFPRQQ